MDYPIEDNFIKDTNMWMLEEHAKNMKRIFRNLGLKEDRIGNADTISRQFILESLAW